MVHNPLAACSKDIMAASSSSDTSCHIVAAWESFKVRTIQVLVSTFKVLVALQIVINPLDLTDSLITVLVQHGL